MKRIIAALILFFALFVPLRAADWSQVVKQVEKSVVWAQVGDDGGCTAFVINQDKHYLLTAAHCYPSEHGVLWVDFVPTRIVALDKQGDLMIVEAKDLDPALPALKLAAKNPSIGTEVMSIGYGYALERPFFRQAHVQDDKMALPGVTGGPFISTDSPFVGGQSGGPVVNAAGEVVAIVQRGDGGTTGLGVGADTIRARVGRFFGAAPSAK
jgi:S1-C subfamily serine protease